MSDPEPREPGDAESSDGGGDGLPPARVPPPPEREQPTFNLGEAWLTLTPAGRAVIVLLWLALFAAAFVGFYFAFVEEDDGGTDTTSTVATAPAPPPVETLPPPTVTDTVIDPVPVPEPVPVPVDPVEPVDPAAPATPDFSGEGPLDLEVVDVNTQSTLAWTNVGGTEFRLTASDPDRPLVSSTELEGNIGLEPGSYRLQVEAGGTWTVEIIPS